MCGIVVDHGGVQSESGQRMLARIEHRGPDDVGSRQVAGTWLGHTRLSIVDVVGGAQPLGDDAGTWMVGNGEIYNHADLRQQLGPQRFRTGSDNEAALHAVTAWGPEGVAELHGMFAIVVANDDGGIVAARDPLGIKPLYWARSDQRRLFASELRAFDPGVRADVETFPPGHWWTPEHGLVRYADLTTDDAMFTDPEGARTALHAALDAAVRRRLMSDVGVGVFLSGGLDSSIVAALAAPATAERGERLQSFATGLAGSADLAAARRVAEHLDLDHHEVVYTADELIAAVPDVVDALESFEPSLVRSALPNFFLARLASRHAKVVLTGEGADELFAGYDYLRGVAETDLASELLSSVKGLHDLNLQRCDRLTMAHGLEARVPFLDLDVIAVAQRIPVAWKLPGERGEEKRLLREAFEGMLPDDILWRRKEQFGDGSGAGAVLRDRAVEAVEPDLPRAPQLPEPRTAEEHAYQQLFTRTHAGFDPRAVLGRFATS